MKKIGIFFCLCVTFFFACQKEDPISDPIDPIVEPPILVKKHFEILPSSSNYLSCYHGRDSVVFEDSLGNELVLSVNSHLNLIGTVTWSEGDSVIYEYTYKGDFIGLSDDSLKYLFWIDLKPRLYTPDFYPDSIETVDGLSIFFGQSINLGYGVFYKIIDLRAYSNSVNFGISNIIEPSRTFYGTTFFEVEHTPYDDSKLLLYFNKTYGIVAFSDLNHKFWRLKI
jgi:hypothetical protein